MTGTEGTGRNASRRAVVAAAGATCLAAALAACGDSGDASQPKDDTAAPDSGGDSGDGGDGAGAALAAAADIPVGGGKVFPEQKVVVTQPTEGEFRAYAAICTHQGAALNEVTGGTINCPLHGSKFAVADGSVKKGPATQPLPGKKVTVDGDSIKLG